MKNLKFLSFLLLCGIVIVAGCEKTNNPEKLSCDGEDVCPVEDTIENPGIVIEESPSVIVEANDLGDLNGNGEGTRDEEVVFENNEQTVEESIDEPMMRKMLINEDATPEEIENDMIETCENIGGTWADGTCSLEDGSQIAF